MINKDLDALTYSTKHPRPKKARTITKPLKSLPQGMSNAASYQDFFPIPGMSTQNDDAVGEGNIPGINQ